MLEPTHIRVIGPAGRRRQAVPIRWEDMRLVDKAALDELQAMGSDGPYGDAFDLLSELTVTEPPAPALAQRTVDEDFV
jgi:hypothetical protein